MSAAPPVLDLEPEELALVRAVLARHIPDREVWAFGSRVKGTARPYSDLDLAVVSDAPLPLALSAALAEEFSASALRWRVDLVDWARTSAPFRAVIAQAKVVVQAAAPSGAAPPGRAADGDGEGGRG